MSDTRWSYLDSEKRQQGPCSRDAVLELLGNGEISRHTLVWRSGMQDWLKLEDTPEFKTAVMFAGPQPFEQPAGSLTASRSGSGGRHGGVPGFVKLLAVIAVIGCIVFANRAYLLLPGSGGVVDSELSDRWFSQDNSEGAIIDCTFSRKGGRGANGGLRYRISALVSAGTARRRRLPVDTKGESRIVVRDAGGKEVFNQMVSNAKLCPS